MHRDFPENPQSIWQRAPGAVTALALAAPASLYSAYRSYRGIQDTAEENRERRFQSQLPQATPQQIQQGIRLRRQQSVFRKPINPQQQNMMDVERPQTKRRFRGRRPNRKRYRGPDPYPTGPIITSVPRSMARMRGVTPGVDDIYVKMKTAIGYNMNAATLCQPALIRGNCIFDPDHTGGDYMNSGAHHPLGFDQYMAFFNHFQVMASKVRFTCWPPHTTSHWQVMYMFPSDGGDVDTAPARILNQQYVKSKALGHFHTAVGAGLQPQTITMYAKSKKVLGYRTLRGVTETYGDASTSPGKVWYWHLGTFNLDEGTTTDPVILSYAEVTYYVRFFGNKRLAQST